MIVAMRQYGTTLGTRNLGRLVYDELQRLLLQCGSERIVLDFDGVRAVTNSFADEVFGRLVETIGLEELQNRTTFRNIDRLSALSIRIAIDSCVQSEMVAL